jgi:putative glutamine amidotransferase
VCRGGTLYQHVPEDIGGDIQHRQSEPGRVATHRVRIEPVSRLAKALGQSQMDVNSFHHQAVRDLGHRLRAVAWAPDGVIEGIEATDRDFVLAVQWHAESLTAREDHRQLFARFIEAAGTPAEARRTAA